MVLANEQNGASTRNHHFPKILGVIVLASTALAGCGDSSDTLDEPSLTVTSSSSSTTTTSETSTEASSTETSSTQTSHKAEEPQPEPTFVGCYEANAALLSDGSVVTDTVNCGVEEEPQPPAEPECTGGAAECGYGYDEEGNPNPSSGELQTQWGCQQGYITDPELCAAVSGL